MKIKPHLKYITELVASKESSQVEADTGSGKSIMIPCELVKEFNYRVFVSVPKVTSATTLSKYAQRIYPNIRVGYGAKSVANYDNRTQVVYATAGHVHKKMLNYVDKGVIRDINFCDVLVVDEMHTGSVDNELIIDLLLEAKEQGKKVPKVLFLSATPVENNYTPKPEIYHIDIGHAYPVDLQYVPAESRSEDDVYSKAVSIAKSLPKEDGDILIFAHGKKAIFAMEHTLHSTNPDDLILPAYSGLSDNELEAIYTPSEKRKIILATNIVESSVTVDGLGVVIDPLLENVASTSSTGGLMLTVGNICKDSARQRLGRVGRTRKGKCFRIISSKDYDLLDDHITPEIHRVPIHEIVMELISSGLDPKKILRGVGASKIQESIDLLTELEAIKRPIGSNDFKDSTVTELGHFIPTVPMGVRNGAFLYHWLNQGRPMYAGVVIASIIEGYQSPGYFYIPRRKQGELVMDYADRMDDFNEQIRPHKGSTQIHTYLNLWDSFCRKYPRDHYNIIREGTLRGRNLSLFRRWGSDNSVNQKKFLELLYSVHRIYSSVRDNRYLRRSSLGSLRVSYFDPTEMADQAVNLLSHTYSSHVLKRSYGYAYLDGRYRSHLLETRNNLSRMEEGDYPNKIYAISTVQIKGKVLVSLAVPAIEEKKKQEPELETSSDYEGLSDISYKSEMKEEPFWS